MQSAIYIALSAQRVLQRQLETVAHNVANMNTVGFRAESVNFDALVSNSAPEGVSFPTVGQTQPSTVQGPIEKTGNPLDVALTGPGWFAIETPEGTAYTRDGRLQIDGFGELRTVNGHSLLDSGQAPIVINPNGGVVEISPDGRISQDGTRIGDIGVFSIPDDSITGRFENSGFFSSADALPIAPGGETKIAQGFIEAANVDAVGQMANLIGISRAFESLSSTLKDSESSMLRSVRELGPGQG